MKLSSVVLNVGCMLLLAAPVMAQRETTRAQQRDTVKESSRKAPIPADSRPPKGMCRVWVNGVPAAQQPASTDCPTAVKNRPANGRVLFGDDYADTTARGDAQAKLPPNVKGFTTVKPPAAKKPPDDKTP
jgi:hypothetical protein